MVNFSGVDPAVTNIIKQPSAEGSTADHATTYNAANTGGWTVATANPWVGAKHWRMSVTASTAAINTAQWVAPNYWTHSPVAAGEYYVFTVRIFVSDVRWGYRISLDWYNSGATLIQSDTQAIQYTLLTGGWNTVKFSGQAPTGAVNVISYVNIANQTANLTGTVDVDGFCMTLGLESLGYIDGDQGPNYAWLGTPHDSQSRRAATVLANQSVRRGLITMSRGLYLSDKLGNLSTDLSGHMLKGSVEMKTARLVKSVFKGRVDNPDLIAPYSDYISPVMTLKYSDGSTVSEQLGVYSIPKPPAEHSQVMSTSSFEAQDLCWNLNTTTFDTPYTLPAGANYVNAAIAILAGEGFTKYNIPPKASTLTAAKTWPITATKLTILNDIFTGINYYTLWFNGQGIPTTFPFLDYDKAQPDKLYFSGTGSEVLLSIKEEPVLANLANKVRVIKDGGSNAAAPIVYTQYNRSAISPTSTVNLGRVIYREIKSSTIADLAAAKEIARRALQDAASIYSKYTMSSSPDPTRDIHEIYDCQVYRSDGYGVLVGRFWVDGWDLALDASTPMTHYINRSEAYL
jgi:hypothetical protein